MLKPPLHVETLVETLSRNLCATANETTEFHEVVLHGETLVFSPLVLGLLGAVAEVESGSTFS